MKTRVSFKYYLKYCLWERFFDSNFLRFLVTLRFFTLFPCKIRAIEWKKFLKLALRFSCFPDLFTEFEFFLRGFLEIYRQFLRKY